MDYVYLKTQAFDANTLTENIIPLKANTVQITTTKTIPSFNIPFSGLVTGESETIALDLGMSSKAISVSGVIVDGPIVKNFTGDSVSYNMTAQEIAQIIASGVDSTGIAKHQAFDELVVLIPSNISSTYGVRGTAGTLVPFTFASRGGTNELDNDNVLIPSSSFPDTQQSEGIQGFVRSFDFTLDSATTDIVFSLQFEVATVIP